MGLFACGLSWVSFQDALCFCKYTFECKNRGRESHAPLPPPLLPLPAVVALNTAWVFSKLKIFIGHTEPSDSFYICCTYILLFTLVLFNQDYDEQAFEVFSVSHFGNNAEVITCQDILRHLWVYP